MPSADYHYRMDRGQPIPTLVVFGMNEHWDFELCL